MNKSELIEKINSIGIEDISIDRSYDSGSLGALVTLTLKNGVEVFFCQYFDIQPKVETPYVEIFENGNCVEHINVSEE